LTPDVVGLLESYPLLEGNYFNNWFLYYLNIIYNPLDYYIPTLYFMMTMQVGFLLPDTPLTQNAVGCCHYQLQSTRLLYLYLIFDDGYAKPAFSFLILPYP
jgi:hypothetical protein